MREINVKDIAQAVARLAQKTNTELGDDVLEALKKAREIEASPIGREALDRLIDNVRLAKTQNMPLCQDCGAPVVFLDIGQEVHFIGGDLNSSVAQGVRQGYTEGYLRKSIVAHPFTKRLNTGDNTPPIIHVEIVPGEKLKIGFMPKGAEPRT